MSLGDISDEGTPGNISNPEVKLVSADGTWGAAPWESRTLPRDFSFNITSRVTSGFFCLNPLFSSLRAKRGNLPLFFTSVVNSSGISGETSEESRSMPVRLFI